MVAGIFRSLERPEAKGWVARGGGGDGQLAFESKRGCNSVRR